MVRVTSGLAIVETARVYTSPETVAMSDFSAKTQHIIAKLLRDVVKQYHTYVPQLLDELCNSSVVQPNGRKTAVNFLKRNPVIVVWPSTGYL